MWKQTRRVLSACVSFGSTKHGFVIVYSLLVDSVWFFKPPQLVFYFCPEMNCRSSEKVCCTAVSNLSHLEPITKHQSMHLGSISKSRTLPINTTVHSFTATASPTFLLMAFQSRCSSLISLHSTVRVCVCVHVITWNMGAMMQICTEGERGCYEDEIKKERYVL